MNAHVRPAVPFTIAADLNLDEALVPWSRSHGADVTVTRGAVPESLPHPEAEGIAWQYALHGRFFRSGATGDWQRHSTAAQVHKVVCAHGRTMAAFGYSV